MEEGLLAALKDSEISKSQIAVIYAELIRLRNARTNWLKINLAISDRWKGRRSLERIKWLAWKKLEWMHE